ncbi:hypothetical protein [Leptospira weilii]|uniref:Uncharacterized protein n=2 Tax=Leptospira weilii TaxID=28184 RepID=M6Q7N7_9LEPT|nr:hypothetical protein [Leptospira weilii]EMM72640.1 hypothetical protein LEP1GSC038_1895 [Leptospira weilii str. 2006001855]EMN91636.1 hypothetical protein LEP1GSC108_4916 [Leptospira weilii str. UI 13098]OMI16940.1 hypothetical protein BUQ74_12615 [Leptospira weilii serovar Heyan]ULH28395.1 PQQ-like beta-propeller repeat protein [Leptospira weilii]UPY80026.1 PQQ-like beta-propeller repeat protein [Leptospira weilii]
MRRIFVFLTFLMCGTSAFAQNNFLWQTLFGGEQYNGLKPNECPEELPSGVVSLKDGSYVVVGSSNDCSKLDTNSKIEQKKYGAAWSAKIDSFGNPVWWRYLFTSKPVDMEGYTVNVHNHDSIRGENLLATQDGGFITAGSIGSGTYNRKIVFSKYDDRGGLINDQILEAKEFCDGFCGFEDPHIFHLQELSNEKFRGLVSVSYKLETTEKQGDTTVVVNGNKTGFLYTLFGKDGSVKSSKYIPDLEFAPSATVAYEEGLIFAVSTDNVSGREFQRDLVIHRYDSDGKQLWKKRFGSPNAEDMAVSILKLSDGNLLLSGGVFGPGSQAVWLLKFSPKGETIWETKQKLGGHNFMGPIMESPDQGFFGVLSDGEGPMVVVKFDSNGKKVWERKHSQRLYMANKILRNDKGYVILSYTKKKPAQYIDALLIQMDWDGNLSKEALRKNFP